MYVFYWFYFILSIYLYIYFLIKTQKNDLSCLLPLVSSQHPRGPRQQPPPVPGNRDDVLLAPVEQRQHTGEIAHHRPARRGKAGVIGAVLFREVFVGQSARQFPHNHLFACLS